MTRSIGLLLLILFNVSSCSYAVENIDGSWRYIGVVGDSLSIECPDILVLEKNGSCYVLNDCYGLDAVNPITESGIWKSNSDSEELVLSERDFKGNYHLINATPTLTFKVLKLTDEELILSSSVGRAVDEKYERLSIQ